MCKRSRRRDDPLVDLFLRKYKVNLLPMPVTTACCGQVYVQRSKAKLGAVAGSIKELVTPEVTLPDIDCKRPLADIAGERSSGVPVKLGLSLLENFLTVLGLPPGTVNKVHVGYERTRTSTVHFAFHHATRDSMDPFSLGTALIDHTWNERHPWIGPGNRYYVSAGVIRSKSISIETGSDSKSAVDLDLEALNAVGAQAGVSAEHHETGAITYAGRKPLAIGVELYDLRYDAEQEKFEMGSEDVAVDLRRGREVDLPPAFPADDDEALLWVEEMSASPSSAAPPPAGSAA